MSLIREAQQLHHHSLHVIQSQDVRSFIASESFLKAAKHVDEDIATRVFLMIELLAISALDPLQGSKPEDFYSETGGNACFLLSLHRVVNPLGNLLELNVSDPLFSNMLNAVKANLASKMFKAAQIYRRFQPRVTRAHVRNKEKADDAYFEVRKRFGERYRYQRSEFTDAERQEMDAAYAAVFNPLEEKLNERVRKINRISSPGIELGYSVWLANFLYSKMPVLN